MNGISPPMTNFANAGDSCAVFAGNSWLLSCPQIEYVNLNPWFPVEEKAKAS
jgi:hypothetical protein